MKITIRVWHATDLRMDTPVTFLTGYTKVADITLAPEATAGWRHDVPEGFLGEAFHRSQHLDAGPWFTADGIAKLVPHDRVRSTSVGDILEVLLGTNPARGALCLVKGIGFERIDPLTEIDWKRAHGVN